MKAVLKRWLPLFLGLQLLAGCSLVDEDMSDCDMQYRLDYTLKLVTNVTTELRTELSLATDVAVSSALETYFSEVFGEYAHDVDMSFYDVKDDFVRLHHETHTMEARESSYTLNIPVHEYIHLAVANAKANGSVDISDSGYCFSAALRQEVEDTLDSHTAALYSARLPMDVRSGVRQEFDVDLFTCHGAEALVLDTLGSGVKDVRVFATGFATDFSIADSTYLFRYSPVFRTRKVETGGPSGIQLCYACVNFPSRVPEDVQTRAEASSSPALWEFHVYCTLPDGSITQTRLSVREPVLPGHVVVAMARVYPNGALEPEDMNVGVSVTLDWHSGMEHEVAL